MGVSKPSGRKYIKMKKRYRNFPLSSKSNTIKDRREIRLFSEICGHALGNFKHKPLHSENDGYGFRYWATCKTCGKVASFDVFEYAATYTPIEGGCLTKVSD